MKKTKKKPTMKDIMSFLERMDSVISSQMSYIKYIENKIDIVSSTLYGLLEMKGDTKEVLEYVTKRDKEMKDAVPNEKKAGEEEE
tara:strand:- start:2552 stop:2806 length:255 start_codon:yes stop_codon:yes gene_type:complete